MRGDPAELRPKILSSHGCARPAAASDTEERMLLHDVLTQSLNVMRRRLSCPMIGTPIRETQTSNSRVKRKRENFITTRATCLERRPRSPQTKNRKKTLTRPKPTNKTRNPELVL